MSELAFWRWTLEQLNRELTGRNDLTLEWAPPLGHPDRFWDTWGSASDTAIQLDREVVAGWFRDLPARRAISQLMGLNFHEVAHVIFSPEEAVLPAEWEGRNATYATKTAWNVLEDQRIEFLLIKRFPQARRPLIDIANALFDEVSDRTAELTHGRRHLSPLRRQLADAFYRRRYGERAFRRMVQIVDAYVALGPNTQFAKLADHADQLLQLWADTGHFDNEPDMTLIAAGDLLDLDDFDFGECVR